MAAESSDAFSRLPDEMLVEILSRLPATKQRATTSFLSRRWRHLWTLVPSLDFHEDDFLRGVLAVYHCLCRLDLSSHSTHSFRRFSISIYWDPLCVKLIDVWFRFLASPSLHELYFGYKRATFPPSDLRLTLPPSLLLLGTSLRVLALKYCNLTAIDQASLAASAFPFLHTLVLRHVCIEDHQTQTLVDACPALEHLQIQSPRLPSIRISSSANPRLKKIEILGEYRDIPRRLTIEVATLQCLKVSGFDMDDLHLGNSPLLREVELFPDQKTSCNNIISIPPAIECAEILSVGGQIFKDLHKLDFKNLRVLHAMDLPCNCSYDHLITFLQRSPSLHTVYMKCNHLYTIGLPYETSKWGIWKRSMIKSITFLQFMNQKHEITLLQYFLVVLTSLEHMHVAFEHGFNHSPDVFIKKVSRFPTASPYVKIVTSEGKGSYCFLKDCPLLRSCLDGGIEKEMDEKERNKYIILC